MLHRSAVVPENAHTQQLCLTSRRDDVEILVVQDNEERRAN